MTGNPLASGAGHVCMKTFAFLTIVAAVVWYFSRTSPGDGVADSRYFSTKEGTFDVVIQNGVSEIHGEAKLHYGGTTVVGGTEYHKFATVFEPQLKIPTERVLTRVDESGIYSRIMDNQEDRAEYAVLTFPIDPRSEWRDHLRGYWLENQAHPLNSCWTPHKVYRQCVRVSSKGRLGRLHENRTTVYAPDVGLVKLTFFDSKRNIEMTRRPEQPR